MNFSKAVAVFLAVAAVSSLSGCARPPAQSVKNAKEAIAMAQNAEAEKYAAQELNDAQQLFGNAMEMIQKEEKRFFMFRNFSEADKNLDVVVSRAKKAEESAVAEKERQRLEAEKAKQAATAAAEKGKNAPAKKKSVPAKKASAKTGAKK